MPSTTRSLLVRFASTFAVAFVPLTAFLLANYALRPVPRPGLDAMPEILLLALPFTAAMTIPIAVFIAALSVVIGLADKDFLARRIREQEGVRRLVGPVIGAATLLAAFTVVLNTQVLPSANARLGALLSSGAAGQSDREMTIAELRAASSRARAQTGPDAARFAAQFEIEIHKKFALSAACLVLAITGAAIGLRFPRGGAPLVIIASLAIIVGYYKTLVAGETLAERMVVSPFVGMWMANAVLLVASLLVLVVRRPGGSSAAGAALPVPRPAHDNPDSIPGDVKFALR